MLLSSLAAGSCSLALPQALQFLVEYSSHVSLSAVPWVNFITNFMCKFLQAMLID